MSQRLVHSPEQLAQLLKTTRKARKLTQGQLAARVGLSANRFSELESGLGALSVQRLFDLTQALGLELFIADAQATGGSAPEAPPASW